MIPSYELGLCCVQEFIPILLGVLSKQSDSKAREQLLHMLFNLIKKPDKSQRYGLITCCLDCSVMLTVVLSQASDHEQLCGLL